MEDFVIPLSDEYSDIYFVEGELSARYPYSNSMLIGDYLIDTGISPKRLKRLKKRFPINHVLLTHWHEDHISGNYIMKNVKFYCHSKDKLPIENVDKMIPLYNVHNTPVEDELKSLIEILRMQNVRVDRVFQDNDIFNIGEQFKLKVLHTPGHTAGHCAFYELNSKIAFLGDIDLTKHPYYGNLDANLIEFEKSIAKIKKLDVNVVITGHRGIINGKNNIIEEINKYEAVLRERDDRILSILAEKKTPTSLAEFKGKNVIYRKYNSAYKDFELIAELLMIEKHFEKLIKMHKIIKKDEGYVLN
ncbi:MAG: MBL fold metallo-hydrolase [Candidatus Lokiarchaeota archaeon]|nr:MBL fold metallo-hydrolase [Candidatus Lokiarchaeota archaeon]